ncbi:MAG: magnesium transporter [Planctomycetales bacterium]|nr:magnesium transporter [Planctomycetales bacterium]
MPVFNRKTSGNAPRRHVTETCFLRLRAMLNTLYLPEIREMLAESDEKGLHEFCTALHPAKTADFMEGLTVAEAWDVLQYADNGTRSELFCFLLPERQTEIIEQSDRRLIALLVGDLPADERVDILNRVDPAVVAEILPLVPQEERRDILRLGAYPEGTAGSVMTSEIAKLPEAMKVGEAIAELARQASDLETIYYIYIVDDDGHLHGVITCRQLISNASKRERQLSEIMERAVVSVNATDDQEAVADKVARYDLLAIPVVDDQQHLLGIITHDDVIDVVREEAVEDAHRQAAVEPLPEGYLDTGLVRLFWNRGMWLVILFVGSLFTAFALDKYDADLEKVSWLVIFIPMVISTGGNSGSQSAALIITAMTLGEISPRDWLRVVRRELIMGVSLGGFLGVIGFFIAYGLLGVASDSLVVPITILLVVICSTLVGSLLPLLFRRLGLDPALMSNPFVAGIIDIVGILIYMQVALHMLEG